MCGIFGTINKNIPLEQVIPFLIHRGPDAQTSWEKENIQLHHFRLSILDLQGGTQPMVRNNLVIIFNGEIYNHLDVRYKLNLSCKTHSDTETILAAYEKIGPKCLDYFDGMFAMAVYDKLKKVLFIARDRAGKKPVYFYKKSREFVFSSELKAIAKTCRLYPDPEAIDQYFKGSFIGDSTAYRDVTELEGGCYLMLEKESGKLDIQRWWSIHDQYESKSKDDFITAKEKIKNYLSEGVKRRIDSSDLEVGAFLSGGIDSGLVVAAASKVTDNLKTFTVSIPGAYDESTLAKLVAEKYQTDHHIIRIGFDNLAKDFESIVSNYGEPFYDSSAIPSYYISKAAKEHLTVILNGDGADELFGGYRRYVIANKLNFYNSHLNYFWKVVFPLLPKANEKKSKYNYLYRLIKILSKSTHSSKYWALTTDIFQGFDKAFVRPELPTPHIETFVTNHKNWSGLDLQMTLDFDILLSGILLKKMDIATMAHSLEGRSPFLCKELLEYAPTLENSIKVNGSTTKFVLREIAKEWLPSELHHQPKRGFEIPLKNWVDNQLSDHVQEYLNKSSAFVFDYIQKAFVDDLLNDKVGVSKEVRAKMIYQLLVTEIWAKNYT